MAWWPHSPAMCCGPLQRRPSCTAVSPPATRHRATTRIRRCPTPPPNPRDPTTPPSAAAVRPEEAPSTDHLRRRAADPADGPGEEKELILLGTPPGCPPAPP